MPIYEYVCGKCDHEWSDLVASSSSAAPDCPACGADRSEKQFSTFAKAGAGADAGSSRGSGPGCGPGSCGCGRYN